MKHNRVSYLLKNIGAFTLSSFASRILVFLLVPLYTSILTTSEYGIFDLSVTTSNLLYPVLTMNIMDAVMRFTMDSTKRKEDVVCIGMRNTLLSVILCAAIIFVISISGIWPAIQGLEIYIFLFFATHTVHNFFSQFAKGLEKVKDMAIAGVLATFFMILTNILFLLVFKIGLKGFYLANIVAQVVPTIFLYFKIKFWKFLGKYNFDKSLYKEMITYCLPLIATTLGWWVNSSSDRYVVSLVCGLAANGVLSVAYKIPSILITVQNIFTQAWQISAIKEYGDNDTPFFYGRVFSLVSALMILVCSLLIIVTKPLASFLYAKDFYQAWQYVPFLLVSSTFNCAAGLMGPILSARKDSRAMMWSGIIGAGTNVVLNIILVYAIGVQGVTIATAISSYIIYYVRKRSVGDNILISNYYLILLSWLILCIQATLEIYFSLWIVEIVLIVLLIILNKKILKDVFCFLQSLFSFKR